MKKKKSSKKSKKKISKRKAFKASHKKSKKKAIKKAKKKLKSKRASLKKKAKKKAKKVLKKKAKAKKQTVKQVKAKAVPQKKRALAAVPTSTLPQELNTVEGTTRPIPGGFEVERKEVVEGADRVEVTREKFSIQQKKVSLNEESPFSDESGSSDDLIEDLDESDLPPGLKD